MMISPSPIPASASMIAVDCACAFRNSLLTRRSSPTLAFSSAVRSLTCSSSPALIRRTERSAKDSFHALKQITIASSKVTPTVFLQMPSWIPAITFASVRETTFQRPLLSIGISSRLNGQTVLQTQRPSLLSRLPSSWPLIFRQASGAR